MSEEPRMAELKKIPIEHLEVNEWNPNAMDDETFNRLVEEIENVGFNDALQVVPIKVEGEPEPEEGTLLNYRIIGGEHRYHAAKILGYTELPCMVLTDAQFASEDLQKFLTMRLNVLHGKTDPTKFVALYEEMGERYGEEALQDLFAFTDSGEWDQLTKGVRSALEGTGLPKEALDKFDEVTAELQTVDDLSLILNQLFSKYGDTLQHGFMVFTYGGHENVYVAMEKGVARNVKKIRDACVEQDLNINDIIGEALNAAAKEHESEVMGVEENFEDGAEGEGEDNTQELDPTEEPAEA